MQLFLRVDESNKLAMAATTDISATNEGLNVYVIKSSDWLKPITDCFDNGDRNDYRLKVMYARYGNKQTNNTFYGNKQINQTNNTFLFTTDPGICDILRENDYTVVDYDWKSFKYHIDKIETTNLHFGKFPRGTTDDAARKILCENLDFVFNSGHNGSYKLVVHLNRENGIIKGFGDIIFDDETTVRTRRICKLILHNTLVGSSNITCKWQCKNTMPTYPNITPTYGSVKLLEQKNTFASVAVISKELPCLTLEQKG